jgi:hypothetical protein
VDGGLTPKSDDTNQFDAVVCSLRGEVRHMRPLLSDVKYWFSLAEEVRTIAEAMRDPEAARIMLEIARATIG